MQLLTALSNFKIIVFIYISSVSGGVIQDYGHRRYPNYGTYGLNYKYEPYRGIPVRDVPIRDIPIRDITVQDVAVRNFPVREIAVREIPAYNPLNVRPVRRSSCWFCPPIKPVIVERSSDVFLIPKRLKTRNDILDFDEETDALWYDTLYSDKYHKHHDGKKGHDHDHDHDKKDDHHDHDHDKKDDHHDHDHDKKDDDHDHHDHDHDKKDDHHDHDKKDDHHDHDHDKKDDDHDHHDHDHDKKDDHHDHDHDKEHDHDKDHDHHDEDKKVDVIVENDDNGDEYEYRYSS